VELLDLVPVKGTTCADEIIYDLENLFRKYKLSRENTVGFVSDGAPTMIGKCNSAARKKKKNMREQLLSFVPLYLHQGLKMTHVKDTVVEIVNFIRTSALNHHEFVALMGEKEREHGEIIYHTNVRSWVGFATTFF
jgi:hypothetical protein